MRILTLLFIFQFSFSFAKPGEEIPIWPGEAPGTIGRANEEYIKNERIYKVHQPSLTIHLPPKELATGSAVLILPGGGYDHVTIFKEGHHIASWLNSMGISAFVLKYRLDKEEACDDALQTMKIIRENAENWGINKDKVGLMGFSAGAHLLLNTVSKSNQQNKPNFLIAVYPGIDGIDLDGAFVKNATASFICNASDDTSTPPDNALQLYKALQANEVPVELHIYNEGGHGFGLGNGRGAVIDWTARCEEWLKGLGYLDIPIVSD